MTKPPKELVDIKVKIKLDTKYTELPQYETEGSAGMDLRANDNYYLYANDTKLIKTGLFLEIPKGYEAQIRPRSGLALDHSVTTLNSPGTVDSDYRGEVGIILHNHGMSPFFVNIGDRIAQMVFSPVQRIQWDIVDTLTDTDRGVGGFGSTGLK